MVLRFLESQQTVFTENEVLLAVVPSAWPYQFALFDHVLVRNLMPY